MFRHLLITIRGTWGHLNLEHLATISDHYCRRWASLWRWLKQLREWESGGAGHSLSPLLPQLPPCRGGGDKLPRLGTPHTFTPQSFTANKWLERMWNVLQNRFFGREISEKEEIRLSHRWIALLINCSGFILFGNKYVCICVICWSLLQGFYCTLCQISENDRGGDILWTTRMYKLLLRKISKAR